MPALVAGHSVAIVSVSSSTLAGSPDLAVGAAVRSAVGATIGSAVRATIGSAVASDDRADRLPSIGSAVRATVGSAVRATIGSAVASETAAIARHPRHHRRPVGSAVRATIGSAVRATVARRPTTPRTRRRVGATIGTAVLDAGNAVSTTVSRTLEVRDTFAGTVGWFAHRSSLFAVTSASELTL